MNYSSHCRVFLTHGNKGNTPINLPGNHQHSEHFFDHKKERLTKQTGKHWFVLVFFIPNSLQGSVASHIVFFFTFLSKSISLTIVYIAGRNVHSMTAKKLKLHCNKNLCTSDKHNTIYSPSILYYFVMSLRVWLDIVMLLKWCKVITIYPKFD